MRLNKFKRITALLLSVVLLTLCLTDLTRAAPTRKFTLAQAQSLALSHSSDITKQNNQIILKRMKYVEAVKGIKAKIKNLRSFRWTPLLSFKFPQQLDLTNEYDMNIKPLTLQAEIDTMLHRLNDLRYEVLHDVNLNYYDVYFLQESTAFTQARLNDAREQLARNKAKLATGGATQSDVDKAQSAVDTLTKDLSNQLRQLEQARTKLKDLTGVDISVGYILTNPFKSAAIPRDMLEQLTNYTLAHDQTYYEAKTAASTALLNLESYESLMRGQYGGKMNRIQNFINMAKQGMDVDYAAFQLAYNAMLKDLDKPWAGSIKILFFRFTKEWFKGEISGTRYIEDEMYAVYTACMDYANAKKELESTEKDLRAQVRDTYENLVTGWNTYRTLQELAAKAEESLERTLALNQLGKASYSEVADEQTAYQDAQQDALEALKDYNCAISEFDRLTCGAVSKYLKNTGMSLDTGEGGDAYATLDPIHEPYYYIYTSVADLTFYIGVSIPEEFTPTIDAYEVWYNGTQIGTRTKVGDEIRHLTIDYGGTSNLIIRLYNGDTYVDECEIEAAVPRDRLDIKEEEPPAATRTVGSYQVKTTAIGDLSTSELTLFVDASEGAATYSLSYGGNGIYTTEPRSIDKPFTYLTLMIQSLADVTATLYGADGEVLMEVRFDTENQALITSTGAG